MRKALTDGEGITGAAGIESRGVEHIAYDLKWCLLESKQGVSGMGR
jgi:hypothetical protein